MSTPAKDLRAAATKLRDTASNATPGPRRVGRVAGIGHCVSAPDLTFCVAVEPGWVSKGDVAWIALMHPGLAEPLAAVLEDHATDHGTYDCTWDDGECPHVRLARSILGRTS